MAAALSSSGKSLPLSGRSCFRLVFASVSTSEDGKEQGQRPERVGARGCCFLRFPSISSPGPVLCHHRRDCTPTGWDEWLFLPTSCSALPPGPFPLAVVVCVPIGWRPQWPVSFPQWGEEVRPGWPRASGGGMAGSGRPGLSFSWDHLNTSLFLTIPNSLALLWRLHPGLDPGPAAW